MKKDGMMSGGQEKDRKKKLTRSVSDTLKKEEEVLEKSPLARSKPGGHLSRIAGNNKFPW